MGLSFQYGTALTEPNIVPHKIVPEPRHHESVGYWPGRFGGAQDAEPRFEVNRIREF